MMKWWYFALPALALAGSAAIAQPKPSSVDEDDIPAAPPGAPPSPQYKNPPPGWHPHTQPAPQPPPQQPQRPPPQPGYPQPGYYNNNGYQGYQQQPQPPPQQQPGYYNGYQGYPQQQPGYQPYGRPYPTQPPPLPPQNTQIQNGEQPAQLAFSSPNEAARTDALACADALENYHLDVARKKCGDAIAKDDTVVVAHLWMSMAATTPAQASAELAKAGLLAQSPKATVGEKLFVQSWRAWKQARLPDAKRLFDELCTRLPGEKRAFLRRGLFKQVALGDLDGAVADYKRSAQIDAQYAAAQNFLGFALADQGRADEALAALRKYAALAPGEPNAHDSLAALALRSGDLAEAQSEEKKALTIDPRFVVAHATLGDALALSGKGKEARREYAFLDGADDPALHHDGAMRTARVSLFEDRPIEAEKVMIKEAALARSSGRAADAVEAFLEAARSQIERGALGEVARGLREATESLKKPKDAPKDAPPQIDEDDRRRLAAQLVEERAMALAALGECEAADARADELGGLLKLASEHHADDRVRALKGWIAWRAGDDKAALPLLERAPTPTGRLAYGMALARTGDAVKARAIMEELAKRPSVDLETALARPRAAAWLRANAGPTSASK